MSDPSEQFIAEYNPEGIKSSLTGSFAPMSGSAPLEASGYSSIGTTDQVTIASDTTIGTGVPNSDKANDPISIQQVSNIGAGWDLLKESILTTPAHALSVDFPVRRYIMFIVNIIGSVSANWNTQMRFNYDAGAHYSYHCVVNGLAGANTTGATIIDDGVPAANGVDGILETIGYITNNSDQNMQIVRMNIASATSQTPFAALTVSNVAGSWYCGSPYQLPAAITSISILSTGGNFIGGSRIAVYGSSI